jgi:hypothetical protein
MGKRRSQAGHTLSQQQVFRDGVVEQVILVVILVAIPIKTGHTHATAPRPARHCQTRRARAPADMADMARLRQWVRDVVDEARPPLGVVAWKFQDSATAQEFWNQLLAHEVYQRLGHKIAILSARKTLSALGYSTVKATGPRPRDRPLFRHLSSDQVELQSPGSSDQAVLVCPPTQPR